MSVFKLNSVRFYLIALILTTGGCQQVNQTPKPNTVRPTSLRDVPAQRLSYRLEPDTLPPVNADETKPEERFAPIEGDFNQNRQAEILSKMIGSPDKQRVLVLYQRAGDIQGEFGLDLYDISGRLIQKITPETLSLVNPAATAWSPDSSSFAFIGLRRQNIPKDLTEVAPTPPEISTDNANTAGNTAANTPPMPTPNPSAGLITFTTEQIYLCGREGIDLKPLTMRQGLIYYDFVWSPDSSMLAAVASRQVDWVVFQNEAAKRGEIYRPQGRLRLLEKNGRERLLDDNLTSVRPAWSPDSSKVATASETDVKIFDALGDSPTSAVIPLQIQLLTASKAFDETQRRQLANGNANAPTGNTLPNVNASTAPLTPGDQAPISFNPIVALKWTEDKTLYLQTGFVRDYPNSAENIRSYMRWHKLNLSPQAAVLK